MGRHDIEVTKEADVDMVHHGDTITYTYNVTTGTGNVALSNITVTDSPVPDTGPAYVSGDDSPTNGKLDVGETWVYTATHVVTDSDPDTLANTATAKGWWGAGVDDYVEASDGASVEIFRPGIDVEKETDEVAYFNGTEVTYKITVTNTGNCDLTVDVSDDVLGTIVEDLSLPEGENETYDVPYTLTCPEDNYDYSLHSNVVTAIGVDVIGGEATDCDCWTVIIFQWQPRTIGYWGNWDNHWSPTDMLGLLERVNSQSTYFGPDDPGPNGLIRTLLDPVKGKMDADKAEKLLAKQLLAAWLNVKSYEGWTDSTPGEADTSMNPDATVYFDGVEISVIDLLHRIESGVIPGGNVGDMLYAKDILEHPGHDEQRRKQ